MYKNLTYVHYFSSLKEVSTNREGLESEKFRFNSWSHQACHSGFLMLTSLNYKLGIRIRGSVVRRTSDNIG